MKSVKLFIHSFIRSFISNIYIAPFQENYSEVLPTPARLNKAVLRWEKRRWKGSNAKHRRDAVPGWGAHHGESADLLGRCTGKRDKKKTLLGWAEWRSQWSYSAMNIEMC